MFLCLTKFEKRSLPRRKSIAKSTAKPIKKAQMDCIDSICFIVYKIHYILKQFSVGERERERSFNEMVWVWTIRR
jgi:hypothetical protein